MINRKKFLKFILEIYLNNHWQQVELCSSKLYLKTESKKYKKLGYLTRIVEAV